MNLRSEIFEILSENISFIFDEDYDGEYDALIDQLEALFQKQMEEKRFTREELTKEANERSLGYEVEIDRVVDFVEDMILLHDRAKLHSLLDKKGENEE